ncbi:MAG: hypothetical protein L0206_01570 [Actinobacteria bacterium]|nr:hypothetical protein [Actinomycetota bacterium]
MATAQEQMSRSDGTRSGAPRSSSGPELPSLGGVVIGSFLTVTGWTLMMSIILIPAGLLMFIAGLGLMLTPKSRTP